MNRYTIIPSELKYPSAPSVDQEVAVTLEQQSELMIEYDRSSTVSLAQLFDDERQACTTFRPTFKVTYLYSNTYTGTTSYLPFQYNLYYTTPEESYASGTWKGFPQFYEFDFYRPNANDQHIDYKAKSAYTYNWTYYLSYPHRNNYDEVLSYSLNNSTLTWTASTGIPFTIKKSNLNGNGIVSFECIVPHGLKVGESVDLSFKYNNQSVFPVYSLGNGQTGSDIFVFSIFNVGFTGLTFSNGKTGTFRRVVNAENPTETTSKYYIREHKVLTNVEDLIVTKAGFEKNVFLEEKKFEYSSITPNQISRVSQKTSSNAYNFTLNYDLDISNLLDNQKRPISELFLTIINKGYSGYFNQPFNNVGLKQGWGFNLTKSASTWWDLNNVNSNTNINVSAYTKTNGTTKTFYYNNDLKRGDVLDGDFCEWNDYEQIERVISSYYHKIKYNQNVFQTTNVADTNSPGYYYKPHHSMTIRVFSDYVETGDLAFIDQVPSWSYFSQSDQQFRWRDLYSYGFLDNLGRGVDYPFFNTSQYPFANIIFRLVPEGINYNDYLLGVNVPVKPLFDECE